MKTIHSRKRLNNFNYTVKVKNNDNKIDSRSTYQIKQEIA